MFGFSRTIVVSAERWPHHLRRSPSIRSSAASATAAWARCIWRAIRTSIGCVAIKVLREPLFDEELLQRFSARRARRANLRHENIITVYDVGEHEHQPFIAMEYVDGETLAE